jgi:thiamine monophosphate synthase
MNWFLNYDKKMLPDAPANAFMHIGNGNNLVYVDAGHDLVVVVRWITDNKSMNNTVKKILEAIAKIVKC